MVVGKNFFLESLYIRTLLVGCMRCVGFHAGLEEDDEQMPEQQFEPLEEAVDPFLAALNSKCLGPADYAAELVINYTLNRQQILAVAPIAWVMEQMWLNRSNPQSSLADGAAGEGCNCLWLGAGGSGKTYAYSKVLRPMFRRYFTDAGYIVGAPTHAAVRLLGPEAKTLHKWANVSPSSGLDRRSLRSAKTKGSPIEKKIMEVMAVLLDELSMNPPDVYHAAGFRFSVLRQERLMLDMGRYLEQWFGRVPIGVQLGDFLQLRPTAQRSLCEWHDVQRATDAAAQGGSSDEEELPENEAAQHTSNAAELGRLMFKNSLQRVVHFTGSGRFSDCPSGRQLVEILTSMREGKEMSDTLWAALEARALSQEELQAEELRQRLLDAHWGGLAWEQVARLQHVRVGLEGKALKKKVYFVQAIDRATGPNELTKEQSMTALQIVNMTKTHYLMGGCPLYEGMPCRISCILDAPLLNRELPVIVRSIKLHPREPAIAEDAGCVVLQYQPVAVLVEIDDDSYKNIQLPGDLAPRGHVLLRAVASDKAWSLQVAPKQSIPVIRKQIPLAPRSVLTHYGLQGITARNGLVAFLSKPAWMKDPDYALAIYVMLSRPRKLEDLFIIDLPPRHIFEHFLHEHNPLLVQRMKEFEQQAKLDEVRAMSYLRKLQWHQKEGIARQLSAGDLT